MTGCERKEDNTCAVAIDLGATTAKLGLFTLDGALLHRWTVPTRTEDLGKYVLEDLAESVKRNLSSLGVARSSVRGVGIGIPGLVLENGYVTKTDNAGLERVNVREELSRRLDLSVYALNDANAAALGEMWKGAAAGCRDFFLVTLGTGVGGAIVADGKLLAGKHGCAGEIGHMLVNERETQACGCGRRGCLEQYTDTMGLTRFAGEALRQEGTKSELRLTDLGTKQIFEAAKRGDPLATRLVEQFADVLGKALANAAVLIDPEMIILGGGISAAGNFLLERVENAYRRYCYYGCEEARFALAMLGNDAGMYGCLKMVLDAGKA